MEWLFIKYYSSAFDDLSSQIDLLKTTIISSEQKTRTGILTEVPLVSYKITDKGLDHKDFVRYYKIYLPGEFLNKPAVNWRFRFDLEPVYIRANSWNSSTLIGQTSSIFSILYFLSEITIDSILLIHETKNVLPISLVVNPTFFLLNSNFICDLNLNYYNYIINKLFFVYSYY